MVVCNYVCVGLDELNLLGKEGIIFLSIILEYFILYSHLLSATLAMDDEGSVGKLFKQRYTFKNRRDEVDGIRAKFPTKIPVIVERYHKEKMLPVLKKSKFLVPQEYTMNQFVMLIRNRMSLTSTQSFYLIINNKSLASMSTTLQEIYAAEREVDGFLYMTYASQEMFG